MHILAIDIGSFSVKYISSVVDKRKVSHREMSEVILRDYQIDHPDLSQEDAQASIVQEIIDSVARPDTRILFQASHQIITTRFLTLPVKSKKKAELMLPFQLEEDIPYALSEIHYAYRLEGQKSQHVALVELAQEKAMEDFYNRIRDKNSLPNILTTETSTLENYFNTNSIAGPFCVLDFGHKTTKGYFFYNSRLMLTNMSYVAGADIDEMISLNYKIDPDEAIIYKHQNAFLLTSNQYHTVEPAQLEFATAMDKILAPLIAEITRWKVGFKVNYGLSIGHVFICGGTANLKNMASYLTEKLDVKVSLLESFDKVEAEKIDLNSRNKTKYALANMMALGMQKKNRFINLLAGRFQQTSSSEFPFYSLSFLGVRVALASLILIFSLVAERFLLIQDLDAYNRQVQQLMRNDELALPVRLRRTAATNPKPIYDALVAKQRVVRQEISTLQSASAIQALSPLVSLSQIAAGATNTVLTEFRSDDLGEIKATFTSENVDDLRKLKATLEQSKLNDVAVDLDESALVLRVSATAGEP
jgi:general secretion pathway protein L